MKKIVISLVLAIFLSSLMATAVFAIVGNGNFETGDFTNWNKTAFINNGFNTSHGSGGADLSAIVGGPSTVALSLSDSNTGNALKYPAYGHYSARVNGPESYTGGGYGKNGNTISQNITAVLNPNDGLAHIRFTYSAVMVEPVDTAHADDEKPYFRVRAINTSNGNDVLYDFSSYVNEPGKNWQDGPVFSGSDTWKYLDWNYIDLASSAAHPVNAGDNILLEVTAAGCSLGGHPGYVYVDEFTDGDIAGPSINAAGPATITTGATITYTYTYTNGSGSAINPIITATQPTGVTFTSVSDGINCSLLTGTVTCNFTGVGAGASDTFTISGTVTAAGGSQIAHGDYDITALGFPTVGGQTVLTNVPASPTLPNGWDGSVIINSTQNILTVGRPHLGTQIASYDGYSVGSTTVYLPMLFKSAFGGSYNSDFYIQNVSTTSTATYSIKFYDINGTLSCTLNDTLAKLASKNYSVTGQTCLTTGWVGGVVIESDINLVAVGRPLVGTQQMTYNNFFSGSTSVYVPMLFKKAWGTYNAALYIQNVDPTNTATFSLKFYDKLGNLTCTMAGQQRSPLAAKGYWLPTETCVPDGWAGGVLIESDFPLVALARIHAGNEITSYSGIVQASNTTYVPMLFKDAFGGGYKGALYIQNVDPVTTAHITIDYYSSSGSLTCTMTNTLAPMASWGYWMSTEGCMPTGWAGSAVVTSDTNIVAISRPHIGTEVTAYPGLSSGGTTAYLPMLYKNGGTGSNYSSAMYIQNLAVSAADITIKFYDTAGNLSCTISETMPGSSVRGYWLPTINTCQ